MPWTTKTISGRKWDTLAAFVADEDIVKGAIILPKPQVTNKIMSYNENPNPEDPDAPLNYYIGAQDEIDAVLGAPYPVTVNVFYDEDVIS